MKKFLSLFVAAVMALNTATIAFAKDTDVIGDVSSVEGVLDTVDTSNATGVEYGSKPNFALKVDTITETDLGAALKAGEIKIDVTVTDGRNLLAAAPTVKVYKNTSDEYCAVLGLNIRDTYNTDIEVKDGAISLRVRITALTDNALGLAKGDTLSIDEILFDPYYNEINDYGKDMTITPSEVESNNVVVMADALLDVLNGETATFYFDDIAAFATKISNSQKDINLHYDITVDEDFYDAYPEVDFEAIEFNGTPKFMRKGTLTFKAIGDGDTAVYKITNDGLVELEISKYDSIYNTITIENVSTLTSYLIASKSLVAEFVPSPTPDFVVPEEVNPNTGAI